MQHLLCFFSFFLTSLQVKHDHKQVHFSSWYSLIWVMGWTGHRTHNRLTEKTFILYDNHSSEDLRVFFCSKQFPYLTLPITDILCIAYSISKAHLTVQQFKVTFHAARWRRTRSEKTCAWNCLPLTCNAIAGAVLSGWWSEEK